MAKKLSGKTNGYDEEQVKSYVDRIEALNAEKASIMGKALNDCKCVNEDVKLVLDEAKADGINKKSLKAIVIARKKYQAAIDVRENLDDDAAHAFDMMGVALGEQMSLFPEVADKPKAKDQAKPEANWEEERDAALQAESA